MTDPDINAAIMGVSAILSEAESLGLIEQRAGFILTAKGVNKHDYDAAFTMREASLALGAIANEAAARGLI